MLGSMRVMVVTSQKGGTGKTTLSGHIAVEAERNGFGPVALMDADPQGSLASWWNARVAETPHFARTEVSRLHTDIQRLRSSGVRLVIIDTPPAVTSTIRNVVAFADLVVIPTRPSPHDLRAVAATLDIVEYKGKPFVFVVNGATPRARITADAAVALSQHGTVAPVTIHHRTDFASSMIDGRTVTECNPKGKSAQEIAELWTYLATRLAKLEPRPVLAPLWPERPVFGRNEASPEAAPAMPPAPQSMRPPEHEPLAEGEAELDDDLNAQLVGSLDEPSQPARGTLPQGIPIASERPIERPAFGRREGSGPPVSGFGRRSSYSNH
jgi:chromosome partitioning protein